MTNIDDIVKTLDNINIVELHIPKMRLAESVWSHLQCGACELWFALEDRKVNTLFCPYCGYKQEVQENH